MKLRHLGGETWSPGQQQTRTEEEESGESRLFSFEGVPESVPMPSSLPRLSPARRKQPSDVEPAKPSLGMEVAGASGRNQDGTYHFIAAPVPQEHAPLRADVLHLESELMTALNLVEIFDREAGGGGGKSKAETKDSVPSAAEAGCENDWAKALQDARDSLDQDFPAVSKAAKAQAKDRESPRSSPKMGPLTGGALPPFGEEGDMDFSLESEDTVGPVGGLGGSLSFESKEGSIPEDLMTDLMAQAFPTLTPDLWSTISSRLGCCHFEQKHLDLSAGGLALQVGISSREQGRVLQRLRIQWSGKEARLLTVVHDLLSLLDSATTSLRRQVMLNASADARAAAVAQDTARSHDAALEAKDEKYRALEQLLKEERARSRSLLDHQTHSLATLEALFRDLSKDAASCNVADLRAALHRAEETVHTQQAELETFEPVREKASMMGIYESQLKTTRLQV